MDQGAGIVARKGLVEIGDDAVLVIPEALPRDGRHQAEAVAQAGAGRFEVAFKPGGKSFGTVKAEHRPAARVRFQQVGKSGLHACGFITERERPARRGKIPGKPDAVLGGLNFDADEGNAGLFGFHNAGCVSIDVQEVIGKAMPWSELELANRDAATGFNVDAAAILDQPSGRGEQAVDVCAGTVFWPASGWGDHERFVASLTG